MHTRGTSVAAILLLSALAHADGPTTAPVATVARSPGEELGAKIAQRKDPERRAGALALALRMLGADDQPKFQLDALEALRIGGQVKFDRAPFTSPIRRLLDSPDPEVVAAALGVLSTYGGGPGDLPKIAALAGHASKEVRAAVSEAMAGCSGRRGGDTVDAVTLQLLADPDRNVRRMALTYVWGVPVSETVEARMLALSRDVADAQDAVYLGVTTRPLIRRPIAKRLAELLDDPDATNVAGRAAWSLHVHEVAPDARKLVDDALLRTLDDSIAPYVRTHCIEALKQSPGPRAAAALAKIAADVTESDEIRAAARRR